MTLPRWGNQPVLGLDLVMDHELVNQPVNGLPAIFRLQVNDDWFRTQKVVQIHDLVGSRILGFFRVRPYG